MIKLLIGTVINQKSNVLKEFLLSLKDLKRQNLAIDYLFIDYGLDSQTTKILNYIASKRLSITLLKKSHDIAEEKNKLVRWARERDYDYLFLINADLILDPRTLTHLVSLNKDIVSEIYWTNIYGNKLPLRWLDEYVTKTKGEVDTKDMLNHVNKLASHGLYPSNVIGDSTLFSKKALQQDITFFEKRIVIPLINQEMTITQINNDFQYDGFVDTSLSAFHVVSEADRIQIAQYKEKRKEEEKVAICDDLLLKMVPILESYISSGDRKEWEPFISLSLIKKESLLNLRSKKPSVCYPRIILIDDTMKEAVMEFLLVNDFTRFWYHAVITKNQNNWEIETITLKQKESGYERTATENKKKKISLIYHRYSGADTIALSRNIPAAMQEQYDIQLVKEEREIEEEKIDHYLQKINESDIVIGIDAHRIPARRKGQIFVNLWHGFPLKTMYFLNKAGSHKGTWSQYWSQYQYFTSYSPLYNKLFQKTMTVDPNSFIITGQPRNDSLFCKDSKEKLLSLLKLNKVRKKIIFFAPTFRGIKVNAIEGNKKWDNLFGFKAFNLPKFQAFLDQFDLEMVVKLHPYEEERYRHILEKIEGIHLLTEEMLEKEKLHSYEILGAVNLLITDYSSIAYDYLLLDRPIIYTPIDLDAYAHNRGLLLSYNEFTPGPKVIAQDELQEEIVMSLNDPRYYQNKRHQVRDKVHKYQDGNACERVWEFIKSL